MEESSSGEIAALHIHQEGAQIMAFATECFAHEVDARIDGTPRPERQLRRFALPVACAALVCLLATGCGGGEAANAPAAVAEPTMGAVGAVQEADGLAVSIDAARTATAEAMVDIDPETETIDTETLESGEEFLISGEEFLILDVTIANVSTTPQEYIGLAWTVRMPDGSDRPAALLAMTGRDLSAGDLEPGESTSGDVVLIIPADATSLDISYDTRLFTEGHTLTWTITIP